MTAVAGYVGKVTVRTDNTTPVPADFLEGVHNWSFPRGREMLETTNMKDTAAGERYFIAGLKNQEASFSGDYNQGATVTTLLENAQINGTAIWVGICYSATPHGWLCQAFLEKFDLKDDVGGKIEFDCAVKFTGAVVTF